MLKHEKILRRLKIKKLLRVLQAVALAAFALAAYRASGEIIYLASQTPLTVFISACCAYLLAIYLAIQQTQLLLARQGVLLGTSVLARIQCNCIPGKYLPGGIWGTVHRVHAYTEKGLQGRKILLFTAHESAMTFICCAMSILLLFILLPLAELTLSTRVVIGACLVGGSLMIINSKSSNMKTLALGTAHFLCSSASFTVFLTAHFQLNMIDSMKNYNISWLAGYVNLVTPQGIGTSELVFARLAGVTFEEIFPIFVAIRLTFAFCDICLYASNLSIEVYEKYKQKIG